MCHVKHIREMTVWVSSDCTKVQQNPRGYNMVVCSITTKIHHTGVATCTLMLAIVLGMNYKHTPHGFIDFLNFSGIAGWQSWLGWLAWLSWLGWMGCRWAGWAFRAGWLRWLGRLGWLGWLGWAGLTQGTMCV
jgi:hypothetical protein